MEAYERGEFENARIQQVEAKVIDAAYRTAVESAAALDDAVAQSRA